MSVTEVIDKNVDEVKKALEASKCDPLIVDVFDGIFRAYLHWMEKARARGDANTTQDGLVRVLVNIVFDASGRMSSVTEGNRSTRPEWVREFIQDVHDEVQAGLMINSVVNRRQQ